MPNPAMTALDQAFLKAYSAQPPAPPLKRAPEPVAPTLRVEPLEAESAPQPRPLLAITAPASESSRPARPHFDVRSAVKPLGEFVRSEGDATPFTPGLEIDKIEWPLALLSLPKPAIAAAKSFAQQIRSQSDLSRKVIAITGCQRGEGRTTLLAIAARELSSQCRLAILDADFDRPDLASMLGISADQGLETVLDGARKLDDVAITSVKEGMLIVPSCGKPHTQSRLAANLRGSVVLGKLRDIVDTILLDVGPADEDSFADVVGWCNAVRVDCAYVVCDRNSQRLEDAYAVCQRLVDSGIVVAGIVENHAAARPMSLSIKLAQVE